MAEISFPRSPEDIEQDFVKRRGGILRALTTGVCVWKGEDRAAQRMRRARARALHLSVLQRSTTLQHADVEDFYQACDPEKDNLCLYGESLSCGRQRRRC